MYVPDRASFVRLAAQGNLVPVYREILGDMETPVSAFRKLGDGGHSFLLESVEGGERIARYSFLGGEPFLVFASKGRQVTITRNSHREERTLAPGQDPLTVLGELLGSYTFVPAPGMPRFCGGAVGYLGYDLVRFFERLPDDKPDELGLPDCLLAFTDTYLIFDHIRHRILVMANALVEGDPEAAYDAALAKIEQMIGRLRQPSPPLTGARSPELPADPLAGVRSSFTRPQFEQAVAQAKEYITAGDCIQVVLSQRFSKQTQADPFDIYRALRSLNPSPYMYYLSYGDTKIVGSSPERLVSEEAGEVITRPIAGSRPRGSSPAEDERLGADLLQDEKERAEHIMLVDLGRNDLGRVCRYGSVTVDELMSIEKYSHVMHLVSNVRGRLQPGLDQFDVLRACFPAGTVSGAPKVRAMEIIQELEPTRRGPYAGAIGYFSFSGNMDTAITIRTIVVSQGTAHVQAGAGIVADSVPASEYQETVNKAAALLRAIQMAERGLD